MDIQNIHTGDGGTTRTVDGRTISKASAEADLIGAFDECQTRICYAENLARHQDNISQETTETDKDKLPTRTITSTGSIADDLRRFSDTLVQCAGSYCLALSYEINDALRAEITYLGKEVRFFQELLPQLKSFIAPGGCELAGRIHLARTSVRALERAYWRYIESLSEQESSHHEHSLARYINRLSLFLFYLARFANQCAGVDE